jgi:hypothetical protein
MYSNTCIRILYKTGTSISDFITFYENDWEIIIDDLVI